MTQLLTEQETPLIEKTRELCAALVEMESYQRMKSQLDTFVSDPEAQQMYQALSQRQSELVQKQETTGDLTEEEIQEFEDQREKLLAHPVAGGFVSAQQGFEEMRDTVVRYITRTFELGRVPTEEEAAPPKSGCCGGGGGGCGCGSGGCS